MLAVECLWRALVPVGWKQEHLQSPKRILHVAVVVEANEEEASNQDRMW